MTPYAASVKVAYLILAHAAPEHLARLVGVLPGQSPVLIHFDRRADASLFDRSVELLKGRPGVEFVARHTCRWGAFGIVEGTLSLIWALAAKPADFTHATLLSGSDYPIKSDREIAEFLGRHPRQEFIESALLTAPNRWSMHGGFYRTPEKVLCRHLRFRSRVVRIPGLRRMPYGMRPYGGSQWWTLTREAIEHIVRFVDVHPKWVAFSRQSFIPDESFIQTIVSNSHLADRVTGDDLRLVVWDRPEPPYPATLGLNDLAMLESSPKLFARKFDFKFDARVLQALDQRRAARG
jgi:hypothetical protein